MKTEFRYSSKMHLFIIISCILVALGVALGTVCHFTAGGYFNYGADWSSYRTVTVSCEYMDFGTTEKAEEICESAFDAQNLGGYVLQKGSTTNGNVLVYRFSLSVDSKKLESACAQIESGIAEALKDVSDVYLSGVSVHVDTTLLGGGKSLAMCAIALAAVVAFGTLYFLIRYKISMALAYLLANVHNLALFLSLLTITRIPVGTSLFAFAAVTVILTTIGCCFLFGKMRRNIKDEDYARLNAFALTDKSANECFAVNLVITGALAAVAVVLFVLLSISSLSPLAIISPVLCALVSFVACGYGTLFFLPAVYSRFRFIGERFKKKNVRPSAKKAEQSK